MFEPFLRLGKEIVSHAYEGFCGPDGFHAELRRWRKFELKETPRDVLEGFKSSMVFLALLPLCLVFGPSPRVAARGLRAGMRG